jgi:hypothetical protein
MERSSNVSGKVRKGQGKEEREVEGCEERDQIEMCELTSRLVKAVSSIQASCYEFSDTLPINLCIDSWGAMYLSRILIARRWTRHLSPYGQRAREIGDQPHPDHGDLCVRTRPKIRDRRSFPTLQRRITRATRA